MASAIRTLLKKKKLTGEELGKMLLIDLVDAYKERPNLSQEEQNSLPNYIDNPREGKVFNDYVVIHRYLMAMTIDYEAEVKRLNLNYLNLLYRIQLVEGAELAYFSLTRQPIIMTRRDYERRIDEAKAEVESYSYSFIRLMLHEAETYTPKYKEGEATPYDDIFKQLEKQSIPAHMVEKYKTIYNRDSDLEEYNKFDYLHGWIYVYDPAETDDPNSPLEIIEDYPDFVQAVISKYSKLKGLERLAKMEEEDYIRDDLIDFKTAYDLNVFDTKEHYDNPEVTLNGRTINGVAVIEKLSKHTFISNNNIANDSYYYTLPPVVKVMLSESVLDDENFISHIEQLHEALKLSFKRLSGFKYALDKIVQVTGVEQIAELAQEDKTNLIDNINEEADAFNYCIWRFGLLEEEGEPIELRKDIMRLFTLNFTKEDIEIKPHEKEQVEDIISSGSSKNEVVTQLTNFLTRLEV